MFLLFCILFYHIETICKLGGCLKRELSGDNCQSRGNKHWKGRAIIIGEGNYWGRENVAIYNYPRQTPSRQSPFRQTPSSQVIKFLLVLHISAQDNYTRTLGCS